MIRVEKLSARRGTFILHDVSFSVDEGAWGVVIGPAGSGKTTLLECVAGITRVDEGSVVVSGNDVTGWPAHKRGVGFVYQHAFLFPHLSVGENIEYGAHAAGLAYELLEELGGAGLVKRDVRSLSGGERQIVSLARALATQPATLLLDEPFSSLDPARRAFVRRCVRGRHRAWGMTVLQVTHDFTEAGLLGDTAVLLDGGRVLQWGPTARVFREPATPYIAEFLGAENVLHGEARYAQGEGESHSKGAVPLEVQCGPLTIHAVSEVGPGPCHVVIRAGEVVLARESQPTSARNHFVGEVAEITSHGAWARVTVLASGVPLVALLTLPSLADLDLKVGNPVHVSFKAFAVHLC